ncbi:tetratricopeptide repeat protein 21B-like [Lutzomyia longipalpis]|uniref:tetratricopeptide repeat protein 21B-like n=1 Tax=Lutzomyia longipalpis TaxID=7200 RepID=UPI0024839735|nr:tetratricopeptide repeat protein 21B-like [Lutzomyia longipalpis]
MDDHDFKSIIQHYGREKFYHSMQHRAFEGLSKFSGNLCFRFYNGIALVLGNRIQEGIRELTPMQNEREFSMAVILALMFAHKRCSVVDKEALVNLDTKLKEERKQLTAFSAYYSAVFLLMTGKFEKAKEYAEKALKLNSNFPDALSLKGWAELLGGSRISKGTFELFEVALQSGKSIDASLGQVRYYQIQNDYENAIGVLNKLSIRYPELNIPLVEKMKSQLSNWHWDHSLETATRILNLEPTNIEALRIKIIILVCRDGNYGGGARELQKLFTAMTKVEPSNSELYFQIGQLFSRVCGRNSMILEETVKFIEKANQLSPANAAFLTEFGYHSYLAGKMKEATKNFKSATKVDDSAIQALCGLTLCQLAESGPSEQVSQQIEFLTEIQGPAKLPLLLWMSSKLLQDNTERAISLMVEACEIQLKNLRTLSFGSEYLRRFDPDFLLEVAKDLLQYSPIKLSVSMGALSSRDGLHVSLKHSLNILEIIVKACPGLIQGVFLLAKVQFLCGEIHTSTSTLQHILNDIDPTYSEAHLLSAQINIQQKQFQRAAQNLEICLSHNFKVRENPMYHLFNGIIQKNDHQYDEALKSFITAMSLIGVNTEAMSLKVSMPLATNPSPKSSYTLSLADKVTLYLEMVDTYMLMNLNSDATKLMQDAMEEFSGTSEEGRLVIANADLSLRHGNIDTVLRLLGNIQSGQPYYFQAKTKMANIYLTHRKDRVAFAQCFRELVEEYPEPESYIMLGDAYMSIQEPDDALDAYKEALKRNPRDSNLASKLGRAYVKTHQYNKAINYYKEATMYPENSLLKLDLAELYLKLKQFTNAEQTLIDEIEGAKDEMEDVDALQLRTKQLLLLARVREKAGHLNSSLSTLREARDNQYKVQQRLNIESSLIPEQRRILSRICVLMAEQSIHLRDNDQAVHHYKEALKFSPQDITILASIARLYMQVNNMDQCQQTCGQILQIDPNNETASVMMADLSFRRMDFEKAAYHFSQLLVNQPTYWTALARLIEVMRRSARLSEATEFLVRAEQACVQPTFDSGLNYCKGLYEWYIGNPNSALRYFNNARKDSEWGQQAIFNMIEICINPDGELPNENMSESSEFDFRDPQIMAIRTAERLLKELKPRPGCMDNESLNYKLLQNFILLGTRQKASIESALQGFLSIAGQEEYKEHVGPILGMSSAYVMLKQSQRAKNQLKRVAKSPWTFEDAEHLERCWLLLADLYIQANKMEMAAEFLNRVLEHNKSCAKAYELCGMIAEKEQVYRSAATHYDAAWRYGGKSKPTIGYKLAYHYMKSKRFADAIDVCQQVLKLHPDFSMIKKDILDKCRNNLRN